MLFHSPEFIALLATTVALFYAVPRARIPILAAANALFYGAAGWRYLVLFFAVSLATYLCSLKVNGPRGRLYLWLGVGLNLLNLGFFKYTGFVLQNVSRFVSLGFDPATLSIVLPIGISFYTFQMIAYLVDVRKESIAPCRSFIQFWVFIAFFGQLIAGPIMRGKDFIPQIEATARYVFNSVEFKYGMYLIAAGLAKKILLADNIAPFVDKLFAQGVALGSIDAWIAAHLFAFQIYFDFSAYSDIALGIGRLFGYRLTVNFNTPYLSANPREFWRRWHITLSSWIRDYVYIPLGGSRRGIPRQYLYAFLAMTASGLWHGAAWTFVAWGMYHGALSVGHSIYRKWLEGRISRGRMFRGRVPGVFTPLLRPASVMLMFHLTSIGWVLFRARGIRVALAMIANMVTLQHPDFSPRQAILIGAIAAFYILHLAEHRLRSNVDEAYAAWQRYFPAPVRGLVYTAIILILLVFSQSVQTSFIYFQF